MYFKHTSYMLTQRAQRGQIIKNHNHHKKSAFHQIIVTAKVNFSELN